MKIVLDTNILRADFFLRTRRFELLIDFIQKTTNRIILPQVILDEITNLYKRELSSSYVSYKKAKDDLFGKLMTKRARSDLNLNLEKETDLFIKNIKKKLHFKKGSTLPHNNDHLPELVHRAINKIPPFIKSDKEFRDGLIWLSLFDISKKFKNDSVAFISNNTKDFCDKDKNLHPALKKEADQKGVEILFFPSLEDFLKEHAAKIEFITNNWILDSIDLKSLEDEIESHIEFYCDTDIENILEDNIDPLDEVSNITSFQPTLDEFYVYEMSDGTLRIEATFNSEVEAEYESKGEYDYYYLNADSEVHMIVENKTVKVVEVTDSYVYD